MGDPMLKMNYWPDKWDLNESMCPCDVYFNEWVREQQLTGKSIYHFGTGTHHAVGIEQARIGNSVFAITASVEEYQSYISLMIQNPDIARSYLTYFGDVYLANPRLLPDFDVVTMFHLCEFSAPSTTGPEYKGLSDRQLLDLFTDKTRPGGFILLYSGSDGFLRYHRAQAVVAEWEKQKPVISAGMFKTLLVYRKTG
jgi:hypothetical protein